METTEAIDPLVTRALPNSPWESVSPAIKNWDELLRTKIMGLHDSNSIFWKLFSWLSETSLGITFSFLIFLSILWFNLRRVSTPTKTKVLIFSSFIILSLLSDLFASILKEYFGRLKPHVTFVNQFWYQKSEYRPALSFPSNHALNTSFQCFCLWSFLNNLLKNTNWKLLCFLLLPLCLLVSYSRVVLGQHYVLDIVAGFIIGSLLGLASGNILGRLRR